MRSIILMPIILALPFFVQAEPKSHLAKKLENINQTPMVTLENIMVQDFPSLGEIVGAYKASNYLTNGNLIYLSLPGTPVSVGDRFIISRDRGKVSIPRGISGKPGRRVQFKGYVRVTEVLKNYAVAKIYGASDEIKRGDKISPVVPIKTAIAPKEPSKKYRGQIIRAADDNELVGAFQFAFLNKGSNDGVEQNDRIYVYQQGTEDQDFSTELEVPIAELVIVHTSENFSTAYTLTANDRYTEGARFKAAVSEVQYLD